ncbi:hypothetical protein H6S82_08835 [Planktothrix sp. FACHB-1355]|uniref:Uncharacterized protein n=1 Tax=Aerosakkonema funiforme FACHB-1375 TaxID=2949571 RepID=A0A926VD58_9CYAN|nr:MULTISPECIES: hypothetical protein [Oscillatoriales]MBD2181540.1 hypothetical protein [Aerosakkonema funiforme FACHB-1375]MBD3558963.1 hypothetical protein [Planktothrix sp. FACHB-1355]
MKKKQAKTYFDPNSRIGAIAQHETILDISFTKLNCICQRSRCSLGIGRLLQKSLG